VSQRAILFVDLLGVQKMWLTGGAHGVKARISEFSAFVIQQVNELPPGLQLDGEQSIVVSGDSVSVICRDVEHAIGVGVHLFTQAFFNGRTASSPFWLRGTIGRWLSTDLTIVRSVPIRAGSQLVGTHFINEDDLLGVLALEKSGFRGMRLILDGTMISREQLFNRTWDGFKRPLRTITRLKDCTYPEGAGYVDVLWMASSEDQYNRLRGIMDGRFGKSARDQEEFTQAAWTQLVFNSVETLIWVCRTYAGRPGPAEPPQ
jgi:hypothetical protein